jgi:hypothetical protein
MVAKSQRVLPSKNSSRYSVETPPVSYAPVKEHNDDAIKIRDADTNFILSIIDKGLLFIINFVNYLDLLWNL